MSDSRNAVLGNLRQSLRRSDDRATAEHAVEARLATHAANLVPERGRKNRVGLIELFIAEAAKVDVTIDRVDALAAVPRAIAAYLSTHNLPAKVTVAPDPALDAVPWQDQPTLGVRRGNADARDAVTVTGAFAGVAETGTLVLLSSPDSPTGLNFLPDAHIVVMMADRMLGTFEDVWTRVRSRGEGFMPRAVNWITGPSRSADIEQTLLLGAHGPKKLHLVLIDEPGA